MAPPTFMIKFSKLPGLSAPRLTAGISTIPSQRPAMNPPPSPAKSIPAKSTPAGYVDAVISKKIMNRKMTTKRRMIRKGPAPFSAVQLRITRAISPETKAMIDEKFPHDRSLEIRALNKEAIPPQSI